MEAEPHRRARGPTDHATLEMTLQIDGEVGTKRPHPAEELEKRRRARGAIENNDLVDGLVALHQRRRRGLDRPGDVSIRVTVPHAIQQRQGAHDVADGTEQDDQNPRSGLGAWGLSASGYGERIIPQALKADSRLQK